jgi:hypothetical protein
MIALNLDWVTHPLTFYSTLLIGGVASMHLIISTRAELRRRQRRQQDESTTLKEAVEALRGKIEEMTVEGPGRGPAMPAPVQNVNLNQRAAALRMYGRGSDAHTVSAALKLPAAETELLRKVHQILRADG